MPAGSPARYFKGTTEPSPANIAAWREVGFDDSSWDSGVFPFFYGEPLSGTLLPDMRGGYTTVYTRFAFDVAEPADVESLTLRILSDDGFVAWLNGREVARFNVADGDEGFKGAALRTYNEPLPYEDHDIPDPATALRKGQNVLAIQGFNASLADSSDFVIDPILIYTRDDSVPVVERLIPASGAVVRELSAIEILFSEAVNGVEAADLLINGQAATNVTEFGPGQFVFTFPSQPTGPVQVAFRVDHGIVDRSPSAHAFGGGSWTFTVDPDAAPPGVIISEFMANNDRTLRDDEGDKSDWIEIFNAGEQTASLAGWKLTDNPTRPAKWTFPAVSLQPNGYLLVYASGKNHTNSTLPLHTNFKLANDAGSYLALANAGGQIVSVFTNYPAQLDDVSYGRANGAPNVVGYFVQPTPGGPNSTSGAGFSPPIDFSQPSRTYQGVLELALSATNAATVIHYTVDGSFPTESSPAFTTNLLFTNLAVQVRARGFTPGLLPGPTRSEMFVPLSGSVSTFTSDLPVLIIHDFNRGRPPANSDTFAYIEAFEPGTNGITSLTNLPTLASRGIIAARGSSTEGYPKVSLKLELQDEFGFDRDLPLLGLPSESDWVLYAPNNYEPVLIHNPFAHQLSRDIGRYSPRTRFVEIYFVSSGIGAVQSSAYNGIYVLEEKIKVGDDRVDIPKLAPQESLPPRVTGGYLMKIDRADPGDGGFFGANQIVQYVEPKEQEIVLPERAAQRNYLQNYMDDFGGALYGPDFRNPTNGYAAFVHVDSWIDHHLLNVLTFNVDALRLSAYFYKERNGKLHFGPIWDFDRALNSTDGRDANSKVWRSQFGDRGTDFFNYPWWGRLFSDPDFYQAYIDRYQELRRDQFSTTNLWRLTDELANRVRKAQPREQAKWGNYASPRGGFQGEVSSLKTWLSNRVAFMDSQFVRPPTFSAQASQVPSGFQLTINVPANTTVYYTLNGADPRAHGSATGNDVASAAKTYTGPITIDANARVVARARNPSHTALTGPDNPPLKSIWSGPIAATYVVNPFPITVSEIMYHPAGDGANNGFEADDFEFIELLNTGSAEINLVGFELKGGIDFTFSPTNAITSLVAGGRLLLVKNLAAFQARYPAAPPVAGEFSGNMSNDGERLALFGPLEEPVFDFRYEATWQTNTDGVGRSLVLKNESISPALLGDPDSWTPSAMNAGSPGVQEPSLIGLSASVSSSGVLIRITGRPDQAVTVQRRGDLNAGAWEDLQTQTLSPEGSLEITDPFGAGANFYRAQTAN